MLTAQFAQAESFLLSHFVHPHTLEGGAKILLSEKDIRPGDLISILRGEDWKSQFGYELSPRDAVIETFEEFPTEGGGLLEFEYQTILPCVFSHSIYLRGFGGDYYFVLRAIDDHGSTFIGAFLKKDYNEVIPQFIREFYEKGWESDIAWSLPSTTYVLSSLLNPSFMAECYGLFMNTKNSWDTEAAANAHTAYHPDPMNRGLAALKKMPTWEEAGEWLKEQERKSTYFKLEFLTDETQFDILSDLIHYRTEFDNSMRWTWEG